jgi:hypothetical protein
VSRRRYVYRRDEAGELQCIEVTSDWSDAPRGGSHTSEGEIFDGLRTDDGVDISSRKKRREFMKANGLTDPADFNKPGGHWDRADKRKLALQRGEIGADPAADRSRREALARAIETHGRRR